MTNQEKDKKLEKLYKRLCECQDLAEEAGELDMMGDFQRLRQKVDYIRFALNDTF